jgi:hypothetical protein
MSAKVIHVREMADHPDAVYIGRRNNRARLKESPFANPFRIGGDVSRFDAIRLYLFWLTMGDGRPILTALPDLRDKPLACWCRRDGVAMTATNACHGDALVRLLDEFSDDELLMMALIPRPEERVKP